MIGWLLAGAWLAVEGRKVEAVKAARVQARRARPPRPQLAWAVFAAVTVVMLLAGGPGVLPVMAGVAVAVVLHERKRAAEHAAWREEQNPLWTPRQRRRMAKKHEKAGMPGSARVLRDL